MKFQNKFGILKHGNKMRIFNNRITSKITPSENLIFELHNKKIS